MTETYPWAWYSDPAVLERERERIFRPAWHYVGPRRAAWPSRPRTSPARPAGCLRSSPATARVSCAPSSTCASTAAPRSPRARAAGRRSSARTTPGRTASTAGCARRRGRASSTSTACRSVPLRLEEWGPFLFVCADPEAPFPLGELRPAVRPGARSSSASASTTRSRRTGRSPSRTTSSATTARSPTRGSARLVDVDPDAYRLEADGERWSQYGNARDGDGQCVFHLVWPALKINVYPGLVNLSIGPVWPESPTRTVGFLDYFFGPDVDEEGRGADRVRRPGRP